MTARRTRAVVALAALLAVAACTSPAPEPSGSPSPSEPSPTSEPTPEPTPTAEPNLPWGPTEADLAEASADAAALDDAAAAGQVIVARYAGTDPATASDLVAELGLAGVLLFTENVATLEQVSATAAGVQDAVAGARDWPGIVSVDNEGGLVQRLSGATGPWTTFPPLQQAGAASSDPEAIEAAYAAMGRELAGSGITLDFAPDADVTIGPADVTIGTRSPGDDPDRVATTAVAAMQGLESGGVLTSLKHFPGHGTLNVDSHEDLPVLDTPVADLAARDLVPFAAGVEAGAPMVMMGHIAVTDWDPGVPASLSPAAYRYLREDLGFTGVAVTDGLDMGALTQDRTAGEIAAQALIAGADLLLTPTDVVGARDGILAALADGSLSRDRLTEAAGRVIALARWQAELATAAGSPSRDDVGTAAGPVAALAAAAVTVVAGACDGPLVGSTVHLRGGSTAQWETFAGALADVGIDVVPLEQPAASDIRLVVDGGRTDGGDVAVALGSPYGLADADADALLAGYDSGPATAAALAAVLAGSATAPGELPVAVGDLPRSACA